MKHYWVIVKEVEGEEYLLTTSDEFEDAILFETPEEAILYIAQNEITGAEISKVPESFYKPRLFN